MIPKIFHVIWLSEIPEKNTFNSEQIIDFSSWMKNNPDFNLMIWKNNDFPDTKFKTECIVNKNFATLSNYYRLEILDKFGGIYLDDDIISLKPVDELLNDECFFGVDHVDNKLTVINNAVIGSVPNHWFINLLYEKFLNKYDSKSNAISSAGYHIKDELSNYGFTSGYKNTRDSNSKIINIDGVKIYPGDYFYPRYGGNGFTENVTIFDHKYKLRHYKK